MGHEMNCETVLMTSTWPTGSEDDRHTWRCSAADNSQTDRVLGISAAFLTIGYGRVQSLTGIRNVSSSGSQARSQASNALVVVVS